MNHTEAANDIIDQLKLRNQCPLPLQKVVEHIGYKVQLFQPNEKTRTLACGVNQQEKILFANSSDSAMEQRYAFAHAIGHVVLHPGENIIARKLTLHYTNEEKKEWEANQFADELLMETTLFLSKWDELSENQRKMGQAFGLTKERIAARATLLGIL